jgi:drug/metabolite transporter (DMT)-like permease
MRGAAPLLTAFAVFLFLGQSLSPLAWVGLAIATVSVAAFAWPPAGSQFRAHPDRRALFWAGATAVFVALYNVADTHGVNVAPDPLTFIIWLFLIDWIAITATAAIVRRKTFVEEIGRRWRTGVAAGALSIFSFGSALYAFTLMETAKVSALRETAVVFAALMGSRLLGEGSSRRRAVAAATLATGLVLMQFG